MHAIPMIQSHDRKPMSLKEWENDEWRIANLQVYKFWFSLSPLMVRPSCLTRPDLCYTMPSDVDVH
jgi:hypothetical protein